MDIKNILIISNIRCGGTYLMKSLASTYNLKEVWEPEILYPYNKPVVVKANAAMHSVKALVEFSKHFSKVILLDRKDNKAQLESALHMFSNGGNIDVRWTEDSKNYSIELIDKTQERIDLNRKWIVDVSSKLNIPIMYYEDIYLYKVKIEGIQFNPDLSKKLRLKSRRKTVI